MNDNAPAEQPASDTLASAAVAYAKAGYAVLPLKPGTKEPRTRHGKDDATTDVEEIRRWWNTYPDSNIGLRPSQTQFVLDVDSLDGHDVDGHATLAALAEELGPPPDDAPTAVTPTGGLHVWLSYDGKGELFGSLGPGVEVKGHNGYVVAPPSIIGGRRYSWTEHMRRSTCFRGRLCAVQRCFVVWFRRFGVVSVKWGTRRR